MDEKGGQISEGSKREVSFFKKNFCTVTPLSKWLSVIFFAVYILAVFLFILNYRSVTNLDNNQNSKTNFTTEINSYVTIINEHHAIVSGKVYYFSFNAKSDLQKIKNENDFINFLAYTKNKAYLKFTEIEVADPLSFVVLSHNDSFSLYAKDKNNVYCAGKILTEADHNSFILVDDYFAKDNDTLFVRCGIYDKFLSKKPDNFEIDVSSFVHFASSYYKDRLNVYLYVSAIETEDLVALGADPNTFQILTSGFSRDSNNLYYGWNGIGAIEKSIIFEDSDPDTFVDLGPPYVKDKNHVYFGKRPYEGVPSYSAIEEADPSSFSVLTVSSLSAFAKDKNHVYYNNQIYDVIDINTVHTITGITDVVIDKNGVYIADSPLPSRVEGVNVLSFRITNLRYEMLDDGDVIKMLAEDKLNKYLVTLTDNEYYFTKIEIIK